jgi:hypothetical protein
MRRPVGLRHARHPPGMTGQASGVYTGDVIATLRCAGRLVFVMPAPVAGIHDFRGGKSWMPGIRRA